MAIKLHHRPWTGFLTLSRQARPGQIIYQPCRGFVNQRLPIAPLDSRHPTKVHPKNPFIKISDEVYNALRERKPVVALETAIYTHGFPYPENTALASHLESVVRANGGVPATIGILNGVAHIGFEAEELIELTASAGNPQTRKASRRDLSYLCGVERAGRKMNGGTTISGTMVLARLAGIYVFATGGLGGVHHGGENTMDISADLTELGRTPMVVISSGCKSFLDIPRTLEFLETHGVGVATFADQRTGDVEFPAFWSRESGVRSPLTITDEREAAAICNVQAGLPVSSGLLFANPIPSQDSISKEEMDTVISQAVHEAEESNSRGSDNTPFVLNRIRELTNGRSVTANRALVESNVARGTRVAVHLSEIDAAFKKGAIQDLPFLDRKAEGRASLTAQNPPRLMSTPATEDAVDVIVAGSLAIDLSCDYAPPDGKSGAKDPQMFTSNPARITQSLGGVGHNIATAVQCLGVPVRLCGSVGRDVAGFSALNIMAQKGMQTLGIKTLPKQRTAQYVATNDAEKNLVLAMADMSIMELEGRHFDTLWMPHLDACKPHWLVVDANWNLETIRLWMRAGKVRGAKIAFEPVSRAKAQRLFRGRSASDGTFNIVPDHAIDLTTPNALELASIHTAATTAGFFNREDWFETYDSFGLSTPDFRDKLVQQTNTYLVDNEIPQQSLQLLPFIPCILTTMGEHGVLLTELLHKDDESLTSPSSAPYILSRTTREDSSIGGIYMRYFGPAEVVPKDHIVSVNGVGDTFLGVLIAGLSKPRPKSVEALIGVAQRASVMSLKSMEAVNPAISALRYEI